MIQLYAMSGACSLAPHIVLNELQLPYELKLIKKEDEELKAELKKINPLGQVPTLKTEEGYLLLEGPAIQQYLVSRKPNTLFPESGKARFKGFEWMNFISTSLHKGFGPIFHPERFLSNKAEFHNLQEMARKNLKELFANTEQRMEGDYCLGNEFSIADAYLFVILTWAKKMRVDFSENKKLSELFNRVQERPAVKAALKEEGLGV